ncbi:c-type cytochrome [Pseudochryseolinea flava]|uniref:Cytochrome c domain-containing protein n=1 Tax=Pseudochryseolinea flava TaxID=2059302 RepID=A0A364Y5X8_9BACT|nr:hypothetical protein DQQ10_06595 [Pseudochryseolinea flava]
MAVRSIFNLWNYQMLNKEPRAFLILLLALVLTSCERTGKKVSEQAIHIEQVRIGQTVFQENCQSCHKMNRRDESMFLEIFDRLPQPSDSYFAKFVRDSKKLKKSGDEYARYLDIHYGSDYEHTFSELTEEEIYDMIQYIKSRCPSAEKQ